jgi:hypothetical protein
MELNLSELDNVNTMNPYDSFDYNSYEKQNGENYWEKPKNQETQIKKKKVSFNDILSNMNLVVNNQGVLQFMTLKQEQSYNPPVVYNNYNNTNNNYNYNSNEFSQTNIRTPQKNKNSEQIDPAVKHSYIYNKYFKDYASSNVEKPEVRVPKTKEEYYQMLLDDRKKVIEQKLRVEQIKSKKLMFTVTPDSTGVNPRNIVPTKNNLRSMNFH